MSVAITKSMRRNDKHPASMSTRSEPPVTAMKKPTGKVAGIKRGSPLMSAKAIVPGKANSGKKRRA